MAPGGTLLRFAPHFGENVLPHGSHEWLPYSVIPAFSKQIGNIAPLVGYFHSGGVHLLRVPAARKRAAQRNRLSAQ